MSGQLLEVELTSVNCHKGFKTLEDSGPWQGGRKKKGNSLLDVSSIKVNHINIETPEKYYKNRQFSPSS